MGWYKTKRIIFSKPNRLDPYRCMSHREAKKLWHKTGYPSNESLIEQACIISGKTDAELSPYFKKHAMSLKSRYIRTYRKPLIIASVLLLIVMFFTLTMPGQALAKNIYDSVTEIIQNILYVRPEGASLPANTNVLPDAIPEVDQTIDGDIEMSGLAEAKEYLDQRIACLNEPEYDLLSVNIMNSPISGETLQILYNYVRETQISLSQQWPQDKSDLEITVDMSNADYQQRALPLGVMIEGLITEDNIFVGYAIVDESIFTISIQDDDINWDMIYDILDDITFF